jgi:uncharacterized repeat protein (TIGR03803 family)
LYATPLANTVVELPKGAGTFTTLASFGQSINGSSQSPTSLTIDANGNLYGTTLAGGVYGHGSIFELANGASSITTLYSFNNPDDPSEYPTSLTIDKSGNLFGTTNGGSTTYEENGLATIFELAKGSTEITTLYNATILTIDGQVAVPVPLALTIDCNGNLYGCGVLALQREPDAFNYTDGLVFELAKNSNTISILDDSHNPNYESVRLSAITIDGDGNLYCTSMGAEPTSVFELPKGTAVATNITSFTNITDGNSPIALTIDEHGDLYGINEFGGVNHNGTIFELSQADIVLNSLSTQDSNEITVHYSINADLLAKGVQSVKIGIYRSAEPTFDTDADSLEIASYDLSVRELDQGANQCITINANSGSWGLNTNTLVAPLVSDPNLPYVVAVIDPEGQLPADVTTDSTQAHFEIYTIIAVTHGQQLTNFGNVSWVESLVSQLRAEYNAVAPNDAVVFPVYWDSSLPAAGQTQTAGFAMYNQIASVAVEDFPSLQPDDIIDVQLIGHSRGASVIGDAMQDLVTLPTTNTDLQHGFYEMTFLDPHPANSNTVDDISLGVPSLSGISALPGYLVIYKAITTYTSLSQYANDSPIVVPGRVNEVEDFFQNNPTSALSSAAIANSPFGIEQYANLWGDPDEINVSDPTATLNYTINVSSTGAGHSEVPLWYLTNLGLLANGSPPPNPIPPWPAATPAANEMPAGSGPDPDQLLVFPASLEVASGAASEVYVVAVNGAGNPDSRFNGSITLALQSADGATLGGSLTENAVDGVAVFTGVSVGALGDGYVLQATSSGAASGNSPAFDVLTDQLLVTSILPTSVPVGTSYPILVDAEDGSGNVDSGFNGQVTVTVTNPSDDSQVTIVTLDAVNGTASGTVSFSSPGEFIISATSDGVAEGFGFIDVSPVNTQPTPSFTGLSAPVIAYGTNSATILGELQTNGGQQAIPAGELVQVTLAGVTQNAELAADGSFSTNFATGALDVTNSPYAVSLSYAGDGTFGSASAASSLRVISVPTSTSVVSSAVVSSTGEVVTLTASVTPQMQGVVTLAGTVQFLVDGQDVGSPVMLSAGGTATLSDVVLSTASHSVQAIYSGDGSFFGASGGNAVLPAIVLDNGQLTLSANSSSSSIAISLFDSGAFDVTIDGQEQGFAAGAVTSIIANGLDGSVSLDINDRATSSAASYVVTGSTVGGTSIPTITYGGFASLELDTGNFDDSIDVQGVSVPTAIYTGAGSNTVSFGDANNTLNGFPAPVSLVSGGTGDTVSVNDQGGTSSQTYVISGTSVSRGDFTLNYSDLRSLSVLAGSGGSVVDWQGNSVPTTIYTGTGSNTINLGDANNRLDGFAGRAVLVGQGSSNLVNVYDQGSTDAHTYAITRASVARDSFSLSYSAVQSLTVLAGAGGNVINWQGNSVASTVITGSGVNTVTFGDANNTLDGFTASAALVGHGDTAVNVNDRGSTGPHTYDITGTYVVRDTSGFNLAYSGIQTLSLNAGSGGNGIGLSGTAAGVITTINAGAGGDTIYASDVADYLSSQSLGALTLNGFLGSAVINGHAGNTTLDVEDANTTPQIYTLTGSTFARDGFTDFSYSSIHALYFTDGGGGNTIDWEGTAAGTTTELDYVGFAPDTINVGGNDDTLDSFLGAPIIAGYGSVGNILNIYDQGTTAAHTYTIASGAPVPLVGFFEFPVDPLEQLTRPTYAITGSSFTRDGLTLLYSGVDIVNVYGGSWGNTIDWEGNTGDSTTDPTFLPVAAALGVPLPLPYTTTTVHTGTGTNTINLGDGSNTLNAFGATATLVGQGTSNTVNVNDQGSTAAHTYTITGSSVSRDGFTLDYSDVQSLTVSGGSGGNTFDWLGDSSPSSVYTGTGSNTINFGDANNTLNSFADYTTLYGQGSDNTLNAYFQGTPEPLDYILGTMPSGAGTFSITGGSGFSYAYDVQVANYYLGSGDNTIDWQGVPAGQTMTIYTGTGTNAVYVGDADRTLDSFAASAVLVGKGNTALIVDDEGSADSHEYTITGSTVSRDGFTLAYSDVQSVAFSAGSGANTLDWQGQSPGATYSVSFDGGSDRVSGSYSAGATFINGAVALTGATAAFGDLTITNQGSLDLSKAATGTIAATSVEDQGSIIGSGYLTLADSGDFAAGNLDLVLGGTTAGINYDQIQAGGAETLTGTLTLGLAPGFAPSAGETFTIVKDTGDTPADGTFIGLPNGSLIHAGGAIFQINYSDDDVVLTAIGAPQVATNNSTVAAVVGQSATSSGTWSQASYTGADAIRASVGTITQTGNNGSGTWSWSYTPSDVSQSQTVTIFVSDGSNDVASTTFTLTVNPDATTTAVQSSADPSALGQLVTFTATVSANAPGSDTPSGAVSFLDGTKVIGSGILSGGVATFTTSALALGSHSITANFAGTSNYTGSPSAAISQVVEIGTSTAVTSSANPSVYGQTATFTATVKAVAPGSGTPAGSVTFLDGTTILGTAILSGGKAAFKTSALAVGGHAITVIYAGGSTFLGSTSSKLTQTVNQDASTTSVSSSVNPAVTGQSVTFTAIVKAVSPGSGTPTGTVTFLVGGTPVDTVTVSAGKATFKTSLSVGIYSITVSYSGDPNFTSSTSAGLTQTVNPDASSSTVTSSASTSVFGQIVTFTATVKPVSPGSGTPTGTVNFLDGTTFLGAGTLSGGVATYTTSILAVGNHSITVSYAGDANFNRSTSSAKTQTINPAATATLVTSSLNPSTAGQSVTFTATVTVNSPGSGIPGGTVTFKDGSKVLGTGTLSGTGQATFTTSSLTIGKHSITASYTATTQYKASTSASLGEVVTVGAKAAMAAEHFAADASGATSSPFNLDVVNRAVTLHLAFPTSRGAQMVLDLLADISPDSGLTAIKARTTHSLDVANAGRHPTHSSKVRQSRGGDLEILDQVFEMLGNSGLLEDGQKSAAVSNEPLKPV